MVDRFKAYRVSNRLNGKIYIGITARPIDERWREHVTYALRGTTKGPLASAIRKHGIASFDIEHIASAGSWEDLCAAEKMLIEQHGSFGRGYNATRGGEGGTGLIWTEEAKRIRVASYLRTLERQGGSILKGRPKSAEHRANIGAAHKGRVFSTETKAKMSAGQKRRVFTDAERERFKRDGDKSRALSRLFTDEQVTFMRNQRLEGVRLIDLATFYGVARSTVTGVVLGATYQNVPMPTWSA